MEILNIILFPLILILDVVFSFLSKLSFGNAFIAITFFACFISLILKPIQNFLVQIEKRTETKIRLIEEEYNLNAEGKSAEEKFLLRDQLYKKYSHNPFAAFKQSISFFALIPFLISVIIVFEQSTVIKTSFFLGVPLYQPDQLLYGYNLFPILMFVSTYIDASLRYKENKSAKNKFLLISIVLFFLVYNLPSSLIIFWILLNLISMASFHLKNSSLS